MDDIIHVRRKCIYLTVMVWKKRESLKLNVIRPLLSVGKTLGYTYLEYIISEEARAVTYMLAFSLPSKIFALYREFLLVCIS